MARHIDKTTRLEIAKAYPGRLAMLHPEGERKSSVEILPADFFRGQERPEATVHREPTHREASLLSLNESIREAMARTVERKVKLHAMPADEDVWVMADPDEMSMVLAALVAYGSQAVKTGGVITMQAGKLPIENAFLEESGCALLSISSTDVDWSCPGPDYRKRRRMGRVFRAIRSIIRGYNGSVRVVRQKEKAMFNIYLPVLHDCAGLMGADARREEKAWRQ